MNNSTKLISLVLVASILSGIGGGLVGAIMSDKEEVTAVKSEQDLKNERIAEFYRTENLVSVSPHTLRKAMDKGSTGFVVVDLRSQPEYEAEHIIGAVSIPAVNITDENAFAEKFRALPQGKTIVTYCYTSACMLSRQVGGLLVEKGIYVKHLNIGWNEWKYDWKGWNSPSEWDTTKPEDYIASGTEPGTPKQIEESASSCSEGELSC